MGIDASISITEDLLTEIDTLREENYILLKYVKLVAMLEYSKEGLEAMADHTEKGMEAARARAALGARQLLKRLENK